MVKGIDKFKEFFKDFENSYIIIGGTACDIYEEKYAQIPRATKDIDIILIVEALTNDFVSRFWDFIKAAGYEQRNKGMSRDKNPLHEYYRFLNPSNVDFPYQVELFSRTLDLINFPPDAHITPIPVTDDLSSLSAILLDNDYYYFTIMHSSIEDGIHLANVESLICLKCKAFLEMTDRRNRGEQVDSKHIVKHKKDVFRLTAMLSFSDKYDVPQKLLDDIMHFCKVVKSDVPNKDFFKSAGLQNITGEQILELLKNSFPPKGLNSNHQTID